LLELHATASMLSRTPSGPSLEAALADLSTMIQDRQWATADPLGLGGLLLDACRVERLKGLRAPVGDGLLEDLLAAAVEGLALYSRLDDMLEPPSRRLAFRELGLAIGLGRAEELKGPAAELAALRRHFALGSAIVAFWRDPEHRRNRTWTEHQDINEVMLATSLAIERVGESTPVG
jgi:hypothetical protein